jgi:D-glycerate 3-kinase
MNTIEISIDDFYLTRQQRQQLAQQVHPLFATRGVPGTHDVQLASQTLDCLLQCAPDTPCQLPCFDKSRDDRCAQQDWNTISQVLDVVLFEGWCNHAPVQTDEQLQQPINRLEREEDADASWRRYANEQLKVYHQKLFDRADLLIYLQVPSFEKVYEWRGLQERKLAQQAGSENNAVMDEAGLQRFIQHYERITRQCLQGLPSSADVVLKLGDDHAIQSMSFKS